MSKIMRFNNTNYNVVNSIVANVADSFVDRQLKTGSGSGETRLYLYQQSDIYLKDFFVFGDSKVAVKTPNNRTFSYYPVKESCFFIKSNILEYLKSVESDYLLSQKYSWESIYQQNIYDINNDYESIIKFRAHNQSGTDTERLYIGSADDIWYLIRRLALPTITTMTILKLQKTDDVDNYIYLFLLNKSNEINILNTKDLNDFVDKVNLNTLADDISNNKESKETISKYLSISDTEVESLVTARLGQGAFRNSTFKVMNSCPFTSINNSSLLIASHIKPWSKCETVSERLDGYNGFMLSPTYDKLFDLGLISFNDDGSLLISSKLDDKTISLLNLIEGKTYDLKNDENKRDAYLEYHRKNVFIN